MEGFDRSVAVLIGIDHYENGVPRLRTPVSDAEALASVLRRDHGFEAQVHANEAATLDRIRTVLASLSGQVGSNDRLFFYFGGHGIALDGVDGPQGYLLPQDAQRDSTDRYLPMPELEASLSTLACRHLLVILDCCFAGAFRWASTRNLRVTPGNLHRERYQWFIRDMAWQAIASAAHDQKAIDVAVEQPLGKRDDTRLHSPFASALLKGLEGAADRAAVGGSGDGVITATELFLYLEDELLPRTNGAPRQTPIFWPLRKHDKGEFVFLVPGATPTLPPAPPLDASANPWRSLEAYESSDADLFFGRAEDGAALAERIARDRFVVVNGASGVGKSSLVRAGLLPRLDPGRIRSTVFRPGTRPFSSLAQALSQLTSAGAHSPSEHALESNSGELAAWGKSLAAPSEVLLVVDQAEELVTMSDGDQIAKRFLLLVLDSLEDPGSRIRILFTLRSEFESQFAQTVLKKRWPSALHLMLPMTQDGLRRVIEGPAEVKVMRFEPPELVDRMINDVVHMPGALPLLSFALSQMYESYVGRRSSDRAITDADYQSLGGGVAGALRVQANKLVDGKDEAFALAARRVLERMVSVETGVYTRRRVRRSEFTHGDETAQARIVEIVDRLDKGRLIVTTQSEGQPYLELAHDALILGWDRLLRWVREDAPLIADLRRLTIDADAWSASRREKSGLLWADPVRLAEVRRLTTSPTPGLNRVETEFAHASESKARVNRSVRTAAIVTLLLVTGIATSAAFVAEEQRHIALSRQLAAQAEQVLGDSRSDALQKAISGWKVRHTPEAALAIADSFAQTRAWVNGHKSGVTSLAYSPDGRRIVTASTDTTARISDAGDGHLIAELKGHRGEVWHAEFSPDGARVATASSDGRSILWEAGTGRPILTLEAHRGNAWQAIFSPDGRYIVTTHEYNAAFLWSTDQGVKLGDLSSGNGARSAADPIAPLGTHFDSAGSIRSAAFSPDGGRVAVVGDDGVGHLFSVPGCRLLATLQAHSGPILHVAWSPDGRQIVTSGKDGTAIAWDAGSGRLSFKLTGHAGAVNHAAYSPDGRRIVTAGDDKSVRVWSSRLGEPLARLDGHSSSVREAEFSPDGRWLVTASADDSARVWDSASGRLLAKLQGHSAPLSASRFSPDGSSIATASADGSAGIWNTSSSALVAAIDEKSPLTDAEFSPDGKLAVVAGEFDGVDEVETGSGAIRHRFKPVGHAVWRADFSRDGSRLVTAGDGAALWDAIRGNLIARLARHSATVNDAVFSADGRRIVTASDDLTAALWDGLDGRFIASLRGHQGKVWTARFSPAGDSIVTASEDGSAMVWDAASGKPRFPLKADGRAVVSASFSADGSKIVTASEDRTARVWSSADGRLLFALPGHAGPVEDAAFSPDDTRLVSVSDDRTARLWDGSGKLLSVLLGHEQGLLHARFSSTGLVVTSSWDSTPRVWNSVDGRLVAVLDGNGDAVSDARFSSSGASIVTAGRDGQARVFQLVHLQDIARLLEDSAGLWDRLRGFAESIRGLD